MVVFSGAVHSPGTQGRFCDRINMLRLRIDISSKGTGQHALSFSDIAQSLGRQIEQAWVFQAYQAFHDVLAAMVGSCAADLWKQNPH